jgi:hypothetical protein
MHKTIRLCRSIAILSLMLTILIARGVSAKFQPRQEPVGPSSQVKSPPRTPVPTVTGYPTRTPTLTPTEFPPGTPTFTPTPTSKPGPPTLKYPPDGGLLPQPVPPGEWYFKWNAKPCYTTINIHGPGGRHIRAERQEDEAQEFQYTTDTYLPDDALGPWDWGVYVHCMLGDNHSEHRTFWVRSASELLRLFIPWVKQGAR